MFNFSANNLVLIAKQSTERFARFTMLDRHTKRTYLLYDFNKAHHFAPNLPYSQRHPGQLPTEFATEIIRLAQEFGDKEFLEIFHRENRNYLEHQQPIPIKHAVEAIKLAHEFGDSKVLDYFYREYPNQRHLGDLPMELTIKMIKLARDFDDKSILEHFYRAYLRNYLDIRPPGELPVELTIETIRLAREFEDNEFLEYFYHEYIRRKEPKIWTVELAIEVNKLAQEFNDRRFLKYVYITQGERETGTVKMVNTIKGFGFITRDQGEDIFVHFSAIRDERNRSLEKGQRVEFMVTIGEKGLKAQDVVVLPRRVA